MITQARLKELLHYDLETGDFTWLQDRSGASKKGTVAGNELRCHTGKTYKRITLEKKNHLSHRLAFLYMEGELPPNDVDHHNGDGTDNRWANLRHATRTENCRNQRRCASNTSGITGVNFHPRVARWQARITVSKKRKSLGYFDNIFDAAAARRSAQNHYNFHENHGQERPL